MHQSPLTLLLGQTGVAILKELTAPLEHPVPQLNNLLRHPALDMTLVQIWVNLHGKTGAQKLRRMAIHTLSIHSGHLGRAHHTTSGISNIASPWLEMTLTLLSAVSELT
jgi:hypothetical protein